MTNVHAVAPACAGEQAQAAATVGGVCSARLARDGAEAAQQGRGIGCGEAGARFGALLEGEEGRHGGDGAEGGGRRPAQAVLERGHNNLATGRERSSV